MDQDSAHMVAASKVPMLKPEDLGMWAEGERHVWRTRSVRGWDVRSDWGGRDVHTVVFRTVKQPKVVRKNDDAPIIEEWVSDDEEEDVSQPKIEKKIVRPTVLVNTARQVNTAHSKTIVNAARPMSYLSKIAHSTVKRPIHKNTSFKNSNINQRVNTVRDKHFNTARPKAVVNAVKGNNLNAVKASACWVYKVLDHGNPQMDLQDKGVIDSGCSRHMTGNMSYLTNYEEIDGGYVAFGGNPKGGKITGKGSGPNWLFDIDALTRTMNYEPIVAGTQSNGFAVDMERKDDKIPRKDSECKDQEKEDNVNNTNNVNTVSSTVNVAEAQNELIDLQSATQTRKMSKNLEEHRKNPKRNKKDERGIMIRNKARLVAQGYTQEKGIDYDEVFALVARIEAIRLFLAYASFKDFVVYQMDVKSAFLYGKIEKEVYVCQPPRFEDP
ncbi:retrovirus-related pol polyprotein from transposon TNT 1-94 [Tanacetum coccineum]